jgi:hypothetical protein
MTRTAGALMVIGSVIFGIGAGFGVPRVFMTADPAVRRRLLDEHPRAWRAAQPLYALGPVVAAIGIGFLADPVFVVACVLMLSGAVAWSYSCYRRGTAPAEFAAGTLPGWPFATYVLLTIAGLAVAGVGLFGDEYPAGLGWVVLVADAVFLAGYVAVRDIPPFVFYLLLTAVGIVVLAGS